MGNEADLPESAGERFYDLGEDNPVTCINCGAIWEPEPVLKSKQPVIFDESKKDESEQKDDADLSGGDDPMIPRIWSPMSTKMPRSIRTTKSIWAATTIFRSIPAPVKTTRKTIARSFR